LLASSISIILHTVSINLQHSLTHCKHHQAALTHTLLASSSSTLSHTVSINMQHSLAHC